MRGIGYRCAIPLSAPKNPNAPNGGTPPTQEVGAARATPADGRKRRCVSGIRTQETIQPIDEPPDPGEAEEGEPEVPAVKVHEGNAAEEQDTHGCPAEQDEREEAVQAWTLVDDVMHGDRSR